MTPSARRRPLLVALVALLLAAGGIVALAINPTHLERDVAQERLDTPGAPLGPGHTLGQTFISRRAGLRRIEFLAVVYEPFEAPARAHMCLDLERPDDPSAPVATACLPVAGIEHNQTLTFHLPPQAYSRGATYRLTLRCDHALGLSVWLTEGEAYAGGEAWEDDTPRQGDLYFRTYHDYSLTNALTEAAAGLGRRAWPIAATLLMLLVPGAAILALLPARPRLEPIVAMSAAAALSLAFWPLLLLWTTTVGLRLGPLGAWAAVVVLAGVLCARLAALWRRGPRPDAPRRRPECQRGTLSHMRAWLAATRRRGPRPGAKSAKPACAGSNAPHRGPEHREGPCLTCARGSPQHDAAGRGPALRAPSPPARAPTPPTVVPSVSEGPCLTCARSSPQHDAAGRGPALRAPSPPARAPTPPTVVPSVSEGPCLTYQGASQGAAAPLAARRTMGARRMPMPGSIARDPWPYVALVVVMLLVIATRALQVRDLALPAWVDSVHHTMIVRLIADGGRVPASYHPYMPVDAFHYHFGFHAGAAALAWLSGLSADRAVLLFGQALNVLAPLAAYTMAWWIGRSRWSGVAAALVVGALCYMPAYYVTWGRYTQLAGLVMLSPLMLFTARALERRRGRHMGRGDRPVAPTGARRALWRLGAGGSVLLLASLLIAGLVLTHYRVLVFYAVWAVPQGVLLLWRARGDPSPPALAPEHWESFRVPGEGAGGPSTQPSPRVRGEGGMGVLARIAGRGALCGALALLVALPWVVGFLARVAPGFATTYGGWSAGDGGNGFPSALLNVGWTRPLLYLAAVGALWGLARRRGEAVVTAAWVGLCLLIANPSLLGLADTWLITNSSVVIAFWLPVGALCGWLVGDVGRLLARARLPRVGRVGGQAVSALLLAAVVALAGVGSWHMVDIVNPVTVLAAEEDLDGLAWAREHTPPDALFVVNTGVWQAPMRYGTDAGWWLNVVADRRTTLPSLLYLMGGMDYFEGLNALAVAVEEAESVDDPALLARLQEAGVTHVYVGARGGHLLPRDLDPSSHYRALYTHGPVRIYEVVYP